MKTLRLLWLLCLAAYALLAALLAIPASRCRRLGAVLLFLFFLGAALEIGQLFSPGRSSDWRDLLADSVGILAGPALVRAFQRLIA